MIYKYIIRCEVFKNNEYQGHCFVYNCKQCFLGDLCIEIGVKIFRCCCIIKMPPHESKGRIPYSLRSLSEQSGTF